LGNCWNIPDWESVKELQALCGRLDFNHIYAQRKLISITKLRKLNDDVLTVCSDNFRLSDVCMRLQCEFDFAVDVFSGDIKDIVFKRFYNIAVNVF